VAPTIVDHTLAPPGKHIVNLFGGHAPYKLRDGDWSVEKPKFRKAALDALGRYAPGFSNDIIAEQLLVPEDIERIVSLPQGRIFHGELLSDQLFFKRPATHYADYRTPLQDLYVCGASTHPGGAVSGIPGYNAAREILRDLSSVRAWASQPNGGRSRDNPTPLVGRGSDCHENVRRLVVPRLACCGLPRRETGRMRARAGDPSAKPRCLCSARMEALSGGTRRGGAWLRRGRG